MTTVGPKQGRSFIIMGSRRLDRFVTIVLAISPSGCCCCISSGCCCCIYLLVVAVVYLLVVAVVYLLVVAVVYLRTGCCCCIS